MLNYKYLELGDYGWMDVLMSVYPDDFSMGFYTKLMFNVEKPENQSFF